MRNYLFSLRIIACFAAFVSVLGLADAAASGPAEPNSPAKTILQTEPDVAVTVNGIAINQSAIEARIAPQLERMTARSVQLPPQFIEQYKKQLSQRALDSMITELLLDEKVKSEKIVITKEEVVEYIKEMASQQQPPLSLEDFKALTEAYGRSFEQVTHQTQKTLAYQKLLESKFAGKTVVTEDDARKYYTENPKKFETPEQVRASHILIKLDTSDPNTDPNQALAKARNLLKQIKSGADFAELARSNSDGPSAAKGGDLNFFARGRMVPAFEKAAFALKVGQVSDIVQTQFGYHIIKVTDRKAASVKSFEQVKDDILNGLKQNKQIELANEYIKSLKAQANIVYPPGKDPNSLPPR